MKKKRRKNYDKYIRLPKFQLLISLFFATEKRKEGNRYHPAWKGRQDILSHVKPVECFLWLYFRVLGFMSMAATAEKAEETSITCILQQVHFVGEMMMRDSFQCLMKRMTWRLLRETLLCLSFLIFFSSCRWLQLQTLKTCNIF